jgi:hypothetical protein
LVCISIYVLEIKAVDAGVLIFGEIFLKAKKSLKVIFVTFESKLCTLYVESKLCTLYVESKLCTLYVESKLCTLYVESKLCTLMLSRSYLLLCLCQFIRRKTC